MGRVKRKRFDHNSIDDRIVQSGKEFFADAKGNWGKDFFGNNNPIVLELACGRGEYTVWLAQHFPDKNFLGIDKKGDRMWIWLQRAKEIPPNPPLSRGEPAGLKNIGFLRTIIHHLDRFFAEDEVDEIWIVHPDPRPKWADARRRLTHPRFLAMYENVLISGGLLRLKTDDADLFAYSLEMFLHEWWEVLAQTTDLYASDLLADHYGVQTHYEQKWIGQWRTICYGVFRKV